MALTKTLDEWILRITSNFRVAFRGRFPLGSKAFLGRLARAFGMLGWQLGGAIEDLDRDIVPRADSSDEALSDWAIELGLPNGAGGFGPLVPSIATGGQAPLSGVKGTVYPLGATATSEDGSVQIQLTDTVTISGSPPGFGVVTGLFSSITTGTSANLPAGSRFTWDSAPAGADASFALSSALEGALDEESGAALFERIRQRLQTPPRGGAAEDYRLWAAAAVEGVVGWIYPLRSGTNTVDVVITVPGTGQGRVPSEAQREAVADYINARRPVSVDGMNVILPYAPNGAGHDVKIKIVPSSAKYEFDWTDTAATYLVSTYTPGAPALLELDQFAPASLKAAITAYIAGTGAAPRLQVMSTGRVVNDPVTVVAYTDGGSTTTLTLGTLPSTWTAPTASDRVYAYGPVVAKIADGIVAFCDSLGPSRVSGFADDLTTWNDILSISGIIAVAETAIDTDGTELIQEVPVGGCTIGVAVADQQADDSTGAPEILYLSSVAVVRA